MNFWQIFGLLVSGGLLSTLGGFAQSMWSERGQNHRATQRRTEELADRKFELKREAYTEALKEFNFSALVKFNGGGDRALSLDEALRRNSAITLFDMYAPDSIKTKAALIMHLFQKDLAKDAQERKNDNDRLVYEMQQLSDLIKKDLESGSS